MLSNLSELFRELENLQHLQIFGISVDIAILAQLSHTKKPSGRMSERAESSTLEKFEHLRVFGISFRIFMRLQISLTELFKQVNTNKIVKNNLTNQI